MLIDEPMAMELDFIANMIGGLNGNEMSPKRLEAGIYERPDFGGSHFLPGYSQFIYEIDNMLSIGEYGVCDNYQQILDQCPELKLDNSRKFVVTITPVLRKNQSPTGGWRWHKWGSYIGDKKPQCEYLYDEPEIDSVYVYHIYEKKTV
jgi:hypothetical protein